MKPITPSEVAQTKGSVLPPEVIQAFNELIASYCIDGCAVLKQEDVIERIIQLMAISNPDTDRAILRPLIFEKGWLNVEPLFEAAGWKVEYDKPGYCETYPATFTFIKRRKRNG